MTKTAATPGRSLAERYGALAFDLDGVVYHGSQAVPAAPTTLAKVREFPVRLLFLTNNSARTPGRVAEKLKDLGITAGPEDVLTSAQATAAMLDGNGARGASAFVIGERGITQALESIGVRIATPDAESSDLVVVGWDRELNYEKLRRATMLVTRGARLIATNADASYPGPDGAWPGAGAILAAVTTATGATPTIVGKPARPMFDAATSRLAAGSPSAPLMVGDRLDTDVSGAAGAGWHSLLVFTGVSAPPDLLVAQDLPTYLGSDISAVLEDLWPALPRSARPGDASDMVELLTAAGLHAGEVDAREATTIVFEHPAGGLAATACVQAFGETGLLRSVAVSEEFRGQGLGKLAAAAAVRAGRKEGIRAIALFTETAAGFFEGLGFERVDRASLPPQLIAAARDLECTESATAMMRTLPAWTPSARQADAD